MPATSAPLLNAAPSLSRTPGGNHHLSCVCTMSEMPNSGGVAPARSAVSGITGSVAALGCPAASSNLSYCPLSVWYQTGRSRGAEYVLGGGNRRHGMAVFEQGWGAIGVVVPLTRSVEAPLGSACAHRAVERTKRTLARHSGHGTPQGLLAPVTGKLAAAVFPGPALHSPI